MDSLEGLRTTSRWPPLFIPPPKSPRSLFSICPLLFTCDVFPFFPLSQHYCSDPPPPPLGYLVRFLSITVRMYFSHTLLSFFLFYRLVLQPLGIESRASPSLCDRSFPSSPPSPVFPLSVPTFPRPRVVANLRPFTVPHTFFLPTLF